MFSWMGLDWELTIASMSYMSYAWESILAFKPIGNELIPLSGLTFFSCHPFWNPSVPFLKERGPWDWVQIEHQPHRRGTKGFQNGWHAKKVSPEMGISSLPIGLKARIPFLDAVALYSWVLCHKNNTEQTYSLMQPARGATALNRPPTCATRLRHPH